MTFNPNPMRESIMKLSQILTLTEALAAAMRKADAAQHAQNQLQRTERASGEIKHLLLTHPRGTVMLDQAFAGVDASLDTLAAAARAERVGAFQSLQQAAAEQNAARQPFVEAGLEPFVDALLAIVQDPHDASQNGPRMAALLDKLGVPYAAED